MPPTDSRYDALHERFPDILPETEDDPALTHLVHDLDAYMAAPVPMHQQQRTERILLTETTRQHTQPQRSGGAQTTQHQAPQRRIGVWMGTMAAVLIVALLAGTLLTRMHGPAAEQVTSTPMPTMARQTTPTPDHTPYATSDQFSKPAGVCNPANIQAHLPAHALLFDLAMVSPDEGWAVGAIEDAGNEDPVGSLILHYINCAWTPVVADHSGAALMSVSMVSATDGWAVGGSSDGKQIALHYTGGAWQPVALPGENNAPGVYDSVHMRSAGEGWVVFTHNKNNQGIAIDSLLHLANGHWSAVDSPITSIRDVLPVAQNEAWMAGFVIGSQQTPVLYHYQAGKWTSASLPTGVNIDRLRMVSPNDIWASGHINAPSNWDSDQKAAVLRYDGSHWQQVDTGASGHPQFVQAFNGNTSLAFTISDGGVPDFISSVRYQRGGSWLAVRWPFSDMGMGLVAFGMNTIQRVSADEYWTIGLTNTSQSVLLYFANGAWHEYGG